jgi:protein SMG6
VESFSEDEDGDKTVDKEGKMEPALSASNQELDPSTEIAPVEIQNLLHRKEELEKRHRRQERHRQRVQVQCLSIVFLLGNCLLPHS